MKVVAVWRVGEQSDALRMEAMVVGTLGRHPDDDRPVLVRKGELYELGDLTPGSFVGVYFHGEITSEMMNLLAEMQQMGYVIMAIDASKMPWTQIEIPKFRVVGE